MIQQAKGVLTTTMQLMGLPIGLLQSGRMGTRSKERWHHLEGPEGPGKCPVIERARPKSPVNLGTNGSVP